MDRITPQIGSKRSLVSARTSAEVGLMFGDVVGFTTLTQALGDHAAYRLVRRHQRRLRQATLKCDGFVVELRGDGFLIAFTTSDAALRGAVDLMRTLHAEGSGQDEPELEFRVGLHWGTAIADRWGYFGRNVILVTRISDHASPGEILVSGPLAERAPRHGYDLERPRLLWLKGFDAPELVLRLDWTQPPGLRVGAAS
jgi:class 3 adenylate cyclase